MGCQSGSESENNRQQAVDSTDLKAKNDPAKKPSKSGEKVVLFFGNSITAGYGLDKDKAFPALIGEKIDSLGWPFKVINAGVSGETTSGGNSRVDWVLDKQQVDVFVLELGANDGLRGIPTTETKKNLISIIDKVKQTYPDCRILLTGMKVPPNMGEEYSQDFREVFSTVAEEKDVRFLPFILERVAGEKKYNQEDGIHPNATGHKMVAENVWNKLKPMLKNEMGKATAKQ